MEPDDSSSLQKVSASLDLKNQKICNHCQTSKTSLWRNGPLGPKSLCNACGIRYQRKGMEAIELEIKRGNGKRRMDAYEVSDQKRVKVFKLGNIGDVNGKKKRRSRKKKRPPDVKMTMVGCQTESMRAQSQQYGDDVMKAAIQLMQLSRAAVAHT
ncbi:hypothetical protein ABZP36_001554 [Zizania latifolia]